MNPLDKLKTKEKVSITTHEGSFHADDVFACATLSLLFQKENIPYHINRTRNPETISKSDIVLDIGMEYNHEKMRYDHHQSSGAGTRDNGIPYASFGLIWKHYGDLLTGDPAVTTQIDRDLVQTIDAIDNGYSFNDQKPDENDIKIFGLSRLVSSMVPTWKENSDVNQAFTETVNIAKTIIKRVIIQTQTKLETHNLLKNIYDSSSDKTILVINQPFSRQDIQSIINHEDFSETTYAIFLNRNNHTWRILATTKNPDSWESKLPFPESWRGKSTQELQNITKVSDAIFCHRTGFLAGAKTKEGAIELAQKSLNQKEQS